MVASKSVGLFLALGVLISTLTFANQEVMAKLDADVAGKLIELGDAADTCSDKREAADISVSFEDVRGLNLSRNELLNALFYLSLRNGYACSEPALKELVFAVALKERIHEAYGKPSANILEALSKLAFPSADYLEIELEYLKLAEPARRHLEGIFGTEPFDVNKVLKKLPEIQ
ncbi:hypothetical protein [Pseudomonas paralcaligenes]|uniref:hypothetical protein n=1 Tax=Pseudomonas paralcaligenes TaxID=2772558 RepID=UPI001C81C2DA|nr:hypothetical protein [Pseudomonas paralcaligenes]